MPRRRYTQSTPNLRIIVEWVKLGRYARMAIGCGCMVVVNDGEMKYLIIFI